MASWLEAVLRYPEAAARLIAVTAAGLSGVILAVGVMIHLIGPVSFQLPRMEIPSIGIHVGRAVASRLGRLTGASCRR